MPSRETAERLLIVTLTRRNRQLAPSLERVRRTMPEIADVV